MRYSRVPFQAPSINQNGQIVKKMRNCSNCKKKIYYFFAELGFPEFNERHDFLWRELERENNKSPNARARKNSNSELLNFLANFHLIFR